MNKTFENKVTTKGAAKLTLDVRRPRIAGDCRHGKRTRDRYFQAAGQDRVHHPGRRLHEHRLDDQRHHLPRRRGRHPPLPRLPDRAAGGQLRLHRSLATCCSTANCRPTTELEDFRDKLRRHTMLHEDMRLFYDGFPARRPSDGDSAARWSARCRRSTRIRSASPIPSKSNRRVLRLLAKLPTIAAYAYKKSIGQPFVYPRNDLTYCENFLRMMFAVPTEPFEADPDFVEALESAADRPRRSRAELQHVDRADGRLVATRTCSPRFRPASAPCGARCTAGPTKPASPCCSESSTTAAT